MADPLNHKADWTPNRYEQLRSNVTQLDSVRDPFTNQLRRTHSENGKPALEAIFLTPNAASHEQALDLSFLLDFKYLAEPFAQAFVTGGRKLKPISRQVRVVDLRTGFIKYLQAHKHESIALRDISSKLLKDYLRWCNRTESGKAVWSKGTRKNKYRAITRILRILRVMPAWAGELPADLRIPIMADPKKEYKPTEILDRDSWEAVVLACVAEVEGAIKHYQEGQRLLIEGREQLQQLGWELPDFDDAMFKEFSVSTNKVLLLAVLEKLYPSGTIPGHSVLTETSPYLAWVLYKSNYHHGEGAEYAKQIHSYFYPSTFRQLVPFLILMTMYFAYNPTTIKEIKRSDFEYSDVLGTKRLKVRGFKGRAGRRQIRSYPVSDSPENPAVIFEFLKEWTSRIRTICPAWCADYLFILRSTSSSKGNVIPFGSNVNLAIREFCADHKISPFALNQIRPSALDVIEELFGGDVRAVQAAANHRSPDTYHDHYASDAARNRNWERLGSAMALRKRWEDSDGLIDPRVESENCADVGCATPGWGCLDPYDSPQPGQVKGKLCSAYGACPTCPLAQLNAKSQYACARVLQLKALIENAQHQIQAERWLEAWAPRLHRIVNYWLKLFPATLIDQAQQMQLADLPPLE